MSEEGLFDWFDPNKTLELIEQRRKTEEKLLENDTANRFRVTRSTAYSLASSMPSPEELANARPLPPTAQEWFNELPVKARPLFMRVRFPRVLSRLAAVWIDRNGTKALFEELLLADRFDRAGFPPPALQELHALRDYYFEELNPPDLKRPGGR